MEEGINESVVSEQLSESSEVTTEDKVPGVMPVLEHGHGHEHKTGIPWLDGIIAVSVIFISLLSLVVSIEHGKSMEKMVDQNQKLVVASTLPLLSIYGNQFDPVTNEQQFRLILANNGVGPAIIERFELRFKGAAQTPDKILNACCAQALSKVGNRSRFVYSNVSGSIVPARETRDLITIRPIGSDYKLLQAFEEARKDISMRACYCSVLDECWETDFDHSKRPQPVKECKVSPGDTLW
jgi:hypothetical protein